MAFDPTAQNYGRAQRGQLSPFRDTAKRRNGAFDEEEQQSAQEQAPVPEPAPSPLAKAIAPQQSYGTYTGSASQAGAGVVAPERAQEVGRRVRDAGTRSGSFADVMQSQPQATTYSSEPAASPLEKAIAPTAASGNGYTLTNRGGSGGGSNTFTGFDFGQSDANRDTGKSAKYAFADLASQSGVAMPTSKAGAEEWFRTYIAPGMQALGHEVLDVKGDKALIRNWQGEGWVDFLVNADGANPQLAWQAEGGAGAVDPLASAVGGGAADPVAQTLAQQLGIDTSNPLWKQILDQLIADQSGQSGNTPPHATVRV